MFPNKTANITTVSEGFVTIPAAEYGQLVACRTMLDMIFASRSESGYVDSAVVRCAGDLRKSHSDVAVPPRPEPEHRDGGELLF